MTERERDRFDRLLEEVLRSLPIQVREMFEEAPIIIEDKPSHALLEEMGLDPNDDSLCGLYTGTPMIERSVDDGPQSPDVIHLFREGIVEQAGGWERHADEQGEMFGGENDVKKEIRITILHELGHHFGLDEDDLEAMGYD